MTKRASRMSEFVDLPQSRIALGISGHRDGNATFDINRDAIAAALARIFDGIDRVTARQDIAVGTTRLNSPLAPGSDLIAASLATARGWELAAPLPFGLDLNIAVNLAPGQADQVLALLEGRSCEPRIAALAEDMRLQAARARKLELAEQDDQVRDLLLKCLRAPGDETLRGAFATLSSERAAAASRIAVEQSDLLIAVWEGVTPGALGGTRHTMAIALATGLPVLWVDAARPDSWALLRLPEDLVDASDHRQCMDQAGFEDVVESMIVQSRRLREAAVLFHGERWPVHSPRALHAYRWVEDRFAGKHRPSGRAGRTRYYEQPDAIAGGSAAPLLGAMRALPGVDERLIGEIECNVLRRFAWADGIATYLSDAYRGGMTLNFILSALAIIGGVAYLPVVDSNWKWPFALFEFLLLLTIVGITALGRRRRWHRRWFQTRRVAEYLRHAPMRLLLGVARGAGQWPRGKDSSWPETYAREVLMSIGLPDMVVTQPYLRAVVRDILFQHVSAQVDYHHAKAAKLTRVHHNLDRLSEACFMLAIASVSIYLALFVGETVHPVQAVAEFFHASSKAFTFLGVFFPTVGGAIAGIRYFGDFERFAAISEVAAEKLAVVRQRIERLLDEPAASLRFTQIAELTTAIDDIVIAEIESWQAVFASKTISVPV